MSQAKYYSTRLRRDLVSKVVLESEIARCPNDEPADRIVAEGHVDIERSSPTARKLAAMMNS